MNLVKSIVVLLAVFTSCKTVKHKGLQDGVYAEIQTNKGDILLELYADKTPLTVSNFVSLAEGTNTKVVDSLKGKNYYNGIVFHRVIKNFMIQGGDPTGTGSGTPGYRFGDEFPRDDKSNLLYTHNDAGMLSMANAGPETNGSQFFITHKPTPHLDGKHAVFGKVILTPSTVDDIKKSIKDSSDLSKAIDSTRMAVVNSIEKNDTIKAITILRIGDKAKNFKAGEVFEKELEKYDASKKERQAAKAKLEEDRYAQYLKDKKVFLSKMDEAKALKTSSGLRILKLKEGTGKKVVSNKPITVNYILHIANGKKIQSTYDAGGSPFTFQLDDPQRPMIAGFKEGVLTMKEGDKARLFIPYYIAYGEAEFGPFPPKSDIIFDLEILKIGE